MLRLRSERRQGKARKILLFDQGAGAIVAGTRDRDNGFLHVWDTSSNKLSPSLSLDSVVVELAWLRYGISCFVVLLCADGTNRLYEFIASKISPDPIKHEKYHSMVLANQGSLSCYSSFIASSSGLDLVVRDSLRKDILVLDASEINSGMKLLPGSYIVHIHLLNCTSILVFFHLEETIIEFNLKSKAVLRSISVKRTLSTASVSMSMDLAIFHDAMTGAAIYSLKTTNMQVEIPGAKKSGLIVPLGFMSDGQAAFMGDKDIIRLHFFDQTMTQEIEIGARRIYALDAVSCSSRAQVINIVTAVMPQDVLDGETIVASGGWELQLWELQKPVIFNTVGGSNRTKPGPDPATPLTEPPTTSDRTKQLSSSSLDVQALPATPEDLLSTTKSASPAPSNAQKAIVLEARAPYPMVIAGAHAPTDAGAVDQRQEMDNRGPNHHLNISSSMQGVESSRHTNLVHESMRKSSTPEKEPLVSSKRTQTPETAVNMPDPKRRKLAPDLVVSAQTSESRESGNPSSTANTTPQALSQGLLPMAARDSMDQTESRNEQEQSHITTTAQATLGHPLSTETITENSSVDCENPRPSSEWLMQRRPCGDYDLLTTCRGCTHSVKGTKLEEDCRFVDFRFYKDNSKYDFGLTDSDGLMEGKKKMMEFKFHDWKPNRTENDIKLVKSTAGYYLLPKIRAEIQHIGKPNAKFRIFAPNMNYACDICSMGLFFGVWFCGSCGLELCDACHKRLPMFIEENSAHNLPCPDPSLHSKQILFPVSFFAQDELQPIIRDMESLASLFQPSIPTSMSTRVPHENRSVPGTDVVSIKRYKREDLTDEEIAQLCQGTEPFILVGVFDPAPPSELLDLNDAGYQHMCIESVHDGTSWCTKHTSLEDFFKSWGKPKRSRRAKQIRDYPPQNDLRTVHPKLYQRFLSCLENMFESYMSPRGPLNLFSYCPQESIPPDLGPKLYIAEGDRAHKGTTFVHMDKSSAFNILVHSQPSWAKGSIGARWEIWSPDSIYGLSKTLDPTASDEECHMAQPIISELHHASHDVILAAFLLDGIPRWSFDQMPGEGVVIPPKFPHQVSNIGDCIKIACDFVSPSHLPVLAELPKIFGFMNSNDNRTVHLDLLKLDTMLWYAWSA